MGKIVTFYSYKGGTGRSMALANTAWVLAAAGNRVLVVDWDLEAPGLHRYFRPFLPDPELGAPETEGLIDFVRNYAQEAARPLSEGPRPNGWHQAFADIEAWSIPLRWPEGQAVAADSGGEIRFVPAGRQDKGFAKSVNSFHWDLFYTNLSGGAFFDAVREKMRGYDYTLIDSRTGVSDTSGICTIQMPDVLVVCFTYNLQSIEGAAQIAGRIREQRPDLRILPVPMRVEFEEEPSLKEMRNYAHRHFHRYLLHTDTFLSEMEFPYYTKYAYWERLSPFEDRPEAGGSIYPGVLRLVQEIAERTVEVRPVSPERKQWAEEEYKRLPAMEGAEEYDRQPVPSPPEPIRASVTIAGAVALIVAIAVAWTLWRSPDIDQWKVNLVLNALERQDRETKVAALLEVNPLPESVRARKLLQNALAEGLAVSYVGQGLPSETHLGGSGRQVITCYGRAVDLWSVDNGRHLMGATLPDDSKGCALLPGATRAIAITAHAVHSIEWKEGIAPSKGEVKPIKSYQTNTLESLAVSIDGTRFAVSGTRAGPTPAFVDVWEFAGINNQKPVREVPVVPLTDKIFSGYLQASQSGFLYIESDLKTVRLLGLDKSAYQTLPVPGLAGFALSSSGNLYAVNTGDRLELHQLAPQGLPGSLAPDGPGQVVFAPGDRWLAYGSSLGVKVIPVFDPNAGWSVGPFLLPSINYSLDLSSDGNTLLSNSRIYRHDRALPDARLPWKEYLRKVRAYTTICLDATQRQAIFLESAGIAQSRWEACEVSQGRPVEPPPSPAPQPSKVKK